MSAHRDDYFQSILHYQKLHQCLFESMASFFDIENHLRSFVEFLHFGISIRTYIFF